MLAGVEFLQTGINGCLAGGETRSGSLHREQMEEEVERFVNGGVGMSPEELSPVTLPKSYGGESKEGC